MPVRRWILLGMVIAVAAGAVSAAAAFVLALLRSRRLSAYARSVTPPVARRTLPPVAAALVG